MGATVITLPVPTPRPAEPELPALTTFGIYDLARLWATDRELALRLATDAGRLHDLEITNEHRSR